MHAKDRVRVLYFTFYVTPSTAKKKVEIRIDPQIELYRDEIP